MRLATTRVAVAIAGSSATATERWPSSAWMRTGFSSRTTSPTSSRRQKWSGFQPALTMLGKGERDATEEEIAALEAEHGPFMPSDGEG